MKSQPAVQSRLILAEGPYFEDLTVGDQFTAPPFTLDEGTAAARRAIVGERSPLTLDASLSARVTGGRLASPGLVWDIAIGQSTVATHHVKANLYYKGLFFHRFPSIGDTLHTVTTIVGLRENRRRPDRSPTGMVALHIDTRDQSGTTVLSFDRCAMLPLRDPQVVTGKRDDLTVIGERPELEGRDLRMPISRWALDALSTGDGMNRLIPGDLIEVVGGDVVSSAPELARLTLNIAAVHHDDTAGAGRRLVYGGHAIALAGAQANRAIPGLALVLGWHGCDHLAPVYEGDTLRSRIIVERIDDTEHSGSAVVHLRSLVSAERVGSPPQDVLDWRFAALLT